MDEESCHMLVLTSLVAALKYHDDDWTPYPNSFYAKMGGVSLEELNEMEKRFCKAVDWQFHVWPEEYEIQRKLLVGAAASTASLHTR